MANQANTNMSMALKGQLEESQRLKAGLLNDIEKLQQDVFDRYMHASSV
jgi:hypothetical protein